MYNPFDLNNAFEKQVCERMEEYMSHGTAHDQVLEMIGYDFPYMDSSVWDHCVVYAFLRCHTGADGNAAASIKSVAFLHSDYKDEPLHTHRSDSFQISEDDDIIAAVVVENPTYLYEKARVHLTIHIGDDQVNEFEHTVAIEDRRNTYYIPLNLHKYKFLKQDAIQKLSITINNELIKGQTLKKDIDIYTTKRDFSGIFRLKDIEFLTDRDEDPQWVFDLDETPKVAMELSLEYDKGSVNLTEVTGTYTVVPCDPEDHREGVVGHLQLRKSNESDSCLDTFVNLFSLDGKEKASDSMLPYYDARPDKYIVSIFICDTMICSRSFELIEAPDKRKNDLSELPDQEQEDLFDLLYKDLEEEYSDEGTHSDEEEDTAVPEETTKQKPDPENPFEYLDIMGLKLFKSYMDSTDIDNSFNYFSLNAQTSFDVDGLRTIAVVCNIRDLKCDGTLNDPNAFTVHLLDQTGRELDTRSGGPIRSGEERILCCGFGDFCDHKWERGTYRLEVKWNSATFASAAFIVGHMDNTSEYDPAVIRYRNNVVTPDADGCALEKLERMAGLEEVKEKVHEFMNFATLKKMREAAGLPMKMPSLHARFIGNPGTGKTTVARLIGQIYKDLGLLSSGHVLLMERRDFVGKYYDSEKTAVDNALAKAKGGILLIDEAYNLYVKDDTRDPGRKVIEYLLTALADEENRDWMLVLAGYPDAMEDMLNCNQGLASRVDTVFNFADCDIDTLMKIAELYCEENRYELSNEASARLRSVITKDYETRDRNFGNGRYVKKLMETAIYTKMAQRLRGIAAPTLEQLVTIEPEDIPISQEEYERIAMGKFDEKAIDDALKRLDSLVGLYKVKSAIHNFVHIARYLSSQRERFAGKGLLKWNFTGNTGTGKSTVAQILADILQAMNLIQKNEVTELKGEEIFNVSDYTCNEILRETAKKSRRGLLFIDGDAPEFRSNEYRLTSEQIRFKLASLVADERATGALVIGECSTGRLSLAHSLASNGIYDYDHTFIFDDYTADELYQILLQCLSKHSLTMSEEAEKTIRGYIGHLCENREKSFANARTMKNLSHAIFDITMLRLSTCGDPTAKKIVSREDVKSFVWKNMERKIGY